MTTQMCVCITWPHRSCILYGIYSQNQGLSWAEWHMPGIPAFGRWKQENQRLKLVLSYIGSLRPACAIGTSFKNNSNWGWTDGSAVKSTSCPSRGLDAIPSTHMKAHSYPWWDLMPLLSDSVFCHASTHANRALIYIKYISKYFYCCLAFYLFLIPF